MIDVNMSPPQTVGAVRLMDQIAVARRQPFYAVMGIANYDTQTSGAFGAWLGTSYPDPASEAGGVAWAKYGELVSRGDPYGICTTPVATYKRSLGWQGGVRSGNEIVTVSKLSQEFDLMMALIGLYAFKGNDIQLHHIGRRFHSKKAMRKEAKRLAMYHDSYQLVRPADDHERIYIPVPVPFAPWVYCQEVQYDPSAPWSGVEHIDVCTPDPVGFLRFVAAAYKRQPTLWGDSEPNDPVGSFFMTDQRQYSLGVMARVSFWDVENDW